VRLPVQQAFADNLAGVVDPIRFEQLPSGAAGDEGVQIDHHAVQVDECKRMVAVGGPTIADDRAAIIDPIGVSYCRPACRGRS